MRVLNVITLSVPAACSTSTGSRGSRLEAARQAAAPDVTSTPGTKLRSDYPFLSRPGCPPELKILVSDRITAYHTFSEAWQQLFSCETDDDCFSVASRLIDAYLENRSIGDELDHYRDTGRVLGRHPIFARYAQLQRLKSASIKDLLKEQRKTRDNIWRVRSEMKRGDKPHLLEKRRAKLREYELKLLEINRLLGD